MMRDDTDTPLGIIEPNPEVLKQIVVQIANYAGNRQKEVEWSEDLQFLTPFIDKHEGEPPGPDDSNSDGSDAADDPCSCNDLRLGAFEETDRNLLLTNRGDCSGCIHYVAVSYCLSSMAKATHNGDEYSVLDGGQIRRLRCPPALMERVILYAAYYRYSLIWIDQECINQGDWTDKALGIQAMDLVYQRAELSIAVLQALISEQRHYDAICSMLESDGSFWVEQILIDLLEALEIIFRDPWFTRAWTLQESTSGSRQMLLFIRTDRRLARPYRHSFVPDRLFDSYDTDYIELDLSSLHELLSAWLTMQVDPREDIRPSTTEWANDFLQRWLNKMVPEASTVRNPDTRITCNAAEALGYLSTRQNSVISDRLAILANLCKFDIRVDTEELDSKGYDFTVCAMTLSVLNGDMSLLAGYIDYNIGKIGRTAPFVPVDPWRTGHGFSWWLPSDVSLKFLPFLDKDVEILRIKTLSLTHYGLEVRGCLWLADETFDLKPIKARLVDQHGGQLLSTGIDGDGHHGSFKIPGRSARVTLVDELICTMYELGHSRFASHLFQLLRRKVTSNELSENPDIQRYAEADFKSIFDIESRTLKWPTPISSMRRLYNAEDPWHALEGHLSKWLLDRVLNHNDLLLARPLSCPRATDAYSAFFAGTQNGDIILSPLNNFGSQNPGAVYTWFPSNWRVRTVMGSNAANYKCDSMLAGIWKAEEEWLQDVFLI